MEKGLLDILYELLRSPSKALGEVSERKPLGWAMLTAVFVAVVFALSSMPNPPELIEVLFDREKGSFNPVLALLIWVVLFLIALFIEGGIYHLIAVLSRSRGSYLGMVCGICFACFPFVFFAPLAFMRALLGASGTIFYPIASPFFLLWVFVLAVTAIRRNYHYSLRRAVVVYFAPGFLFIFVPLFVITVLIPL